MVRNSDERDKFIEQFGIDRFDENAKKGKQFEKYVDIPMPEQYQYVFDHFMMIWANAEYDFNGNKIFSFGTVRDYEQCYGYKFTVKEKNLFFKMKNWATEVVNELNKD